MTVSKMGDSLPLERNVHPGATLALRGAAMLLRTERQSKRHRPRLVRHAHPLPQHLADRALFDFESLVRADESLLDIG